MFFRKKEVRSLLKDVSTQVVVFETDNLQLKEILQLIDFTEFDLKVLKTLQPIIKANMPLLVESFYDNVLNVKHLKGIINEHSSVERLKNTLFPHLLDMFSGVINEDYIDKRLKVAKVHYKIGLHSPWYITSIQILQKTIIDIIVENVENKQDWPLFIQSVTRILSLEQMLVLRAYEQTAKLGLEQSFEEGQLNMKKQVLSVSDYLVGSTEEANQLIHDLVMSSEEVYSISTTSHDYARETKEGADKGQLILQQLLAKITDVSEKISQMNKIVFEIEKSSKEVTEVLNIVKDIAEKTNLLALNSAIEAARAGEHGKGFAVVADEVRKLADQTKESTATIDDLMVESNKHTDELVQSLNEITNVVAESRETSSEVSKDYETIIHTFEHNFRTNLDILDQVKRQNDSLHEFKNVVESVVNNAEQLHQIIE